ncbi:MAG: hypothetical protein ACK5P7_04840 [Bdellovibrio sp.]|jgi:hypothetical protein
MSEVVCFKCSKAVKVLGSAPGRREECPHCRSDLHVCKNCEHYDPRAYNECRESSADVVKDKERANFCDYFAAGTGLSKSGPTQSDLLAAAEALFKKPTGKN